MGLLCLALAVLDPGTFIIGLWLLGLAALGLAVRVGGAIVAARVINRTGDVDEALTWIYDPRRRI